MPVMQNLLSRFSCPWDKNAFSFQYTDVHYNGDLWGLFELADNPRIVSKTSLQNHWSDIFNMPIVRLDVKPTVSKHPRSISFTFCGYLSVAWGATATRHSHPDADFCCWTNTTVQHYINQTHRHRPVVQRPDIELRPLCLCDHWGNVFAPLSACPTPICNSNKLLYVSKAAELKRLLQKLLQTSVLPTED